MADAYEPTDEERSEWRAFVEGLPQAVRAVAERLEPWRLYRHGEKGLRGTLASFEDDDGQVRVRLIVKAEWNGLPVDVLACGLDPADLVECDLPSPVEIVSPHAAAVVKLRFPEDEEKPN